MTLPTDIQVVRIPNLPMGSIVDENGMATDDELTFRQTLITNLQRLIGNNGVVLPSLTTAQINDIVAATNQFGQYTCPFGTMFYDTDLNQIWAVVSVAGVPTKKLIV